MAHHKRLFIAQLVIYLWGSIGLSTGLAGCSPPPGQRVATFITSYPAGKEPYLNKITTSDQHQFQGSNYTGPGNYQYYYPAINVNIIAVLLNMINLRTETKSLTGQLPQKLYDHALSGKDFQEKMSQSKKAQNWKKFMSLYEGEEDHYFSQVIIRAEKEKDNKSGYGNLIAIPDPGLLSHKDYFREATPKITAAGHSLINFLAVQKALTNLNKLSETDVVSDKKDLMYNAQTAMVSVGSLSLFISFKNYHFTVTLPNLVAVLHRINWTIDQKNYYQGWVFHHFDYYDLNKFPFQDNTHSLFVQEQQKFYLGFVQKPKSEKSQWLQEKLAKIPHQNQSGFPRQLANKNGISYPQYDFTIDPNSIATTK